MRRTGASNEQDSDDLDAGLRRAIEFDDYLEERSRHDVTHVTRETGEPDPEKRP